MLREAEVELSRGEKVKQVCRNLGVSEQTYYRWRKEYGGMKVSQANREYEDPGYLIPKVDKLVEADVNEPVYGRRVPGTVIYANPGERLHIHVLNFDKEAHSFHLHGLEYGIDSDGAWPFGVQSADGRRRHADDRKDRGDNQSVR